MYTLPDTLHCTVYPRCLCGCDTSELILFYIAHLLQSRHIVLLSHKSKCPPIWGFLIVVISDYLLVVDILHVGYCIFTFTLVGILNLFLVHFFLPQPPPPPPPPPLSFSLVCLLLVFDNGVNHCSMSSVR